MLDQSLLLNWQVFFFFCYVSYSFYVSEIFYGHSAKNTLHTDSLRLYFFSLLSTLIANAYTQAEGDDEEGSCSNCYDQPVVPLQQNCMIHMNKFRIDFIQSTYMLTFAIRLWAGGGVGRSLCLRESEGEMIASLVATSPTPFGLDFVLHNNNIEKQKQCHTDLRLPPREQATPVQRKSRTEYSS